MHPVTGFKPGLVSVVVPSLNRRQFIAETLESILAQPAGSVECLVIDGGSTDGTLEILRSYEPHIRWQSAPDPGPAAAINEGWKLCRGEIVAWLNADDRWLPGCIPAVLDALAGDEEADVLFGNCDAIDEKGRVIWRARPPDWELYQAVVKCDPIIYQPASFIRRRILERTGPLYPDWCHDHDLWIRIALAGGVIRRIDQPLANIRVWPGDAHSQPDLMVPAVLRVVDRAFANPDLPPSLRPLKRRARSYAYLRCIRYLLVSRPSHWLRGLILLAQAVQTDPANIGGVAVDMAAFVRPIARDVLRLVRPAAG